MSVSPAHSKLDFLSKNKIPFCSCMCQRHQTPFQVIQFSVLTCFYSLRFKASFLCHWWVSRDESDVAAIFMDSCSLVPYFVALNRNLVPVFFHFTYLLKQFCCLKPLKGSQILSKYRPCCRRPQMYNNLLCMYSKCLYVFTCHVSSENYYSLSKRMTPLHRRLPQGNGSHHHEIEF